MCAVVHYAYRHPVLMKACRRLSAVSMSVSHSGTAVFAAMKRSSFSRAISWLNFAERRNCSRYIASVHSERTHTMCC